MHFGCWCCRCLFVVVGAVLCKLLVDNIYVICICFFHVFLDILGPEDFHLSTLDKFPTLRHVGWWSHHPASWGHDEGPSILPSTSGSQRILLHSYAKTITHEMATSILRVNIYIYTYACSLCKYIYICIFGVLPRTCISDRNSHHTIKHKRIKWRWLFVDVTARLLFFCCLWYFCFVVALWLVLFFLCVFLVAWLGFHFVYLFLVWFVILFCAYLFEVWFAFVCVCVCVFCAFVCGKMRVFVVFLSVAWYVLFCFCFVVSWSAFCGVICIFLVLVFVVGFVFCFVFWWYTHLYVPTVYELRSNLI